MVFTNLLINIDHGIIPAATVEIKGDLNLNNFDLGLLGSLVYLGLVIGSLIAMPVYANFNTKYILSICLFFNAFHLLLFTMSTTFLAMCYSRFTVGIF